jgi:nucleoside-diphosphate-sugar epimerase
MHSSEKFKYEYRIVRYQNIIGPEMGFGHAIPHIVERFVNKIENPIKIYGYDQTRAFCYIDDAVKGTVGAMESSNHSNNIYHIGNDQEISMEELTKFIGSLLGYEGSYENAMTYPGSVSRRCPNIAKAVSNFGYKPEVFWKDAVVETVDWYKNFFESGLKPSIGGFEPPENILAS